MENPLYEKSVSCDLPTHDALDRTRPNPTAPNQVKVMVTWVTAIILELQSYTHKHTHTDIYIYISLNPNRPETGKSKTVNEQ